MTTSSLVVTVASMVVTLCTLTMVRPMTRKQAVARGVLIFLSGVIMVIALARIIYLGVFK